MYLKNIELDIPNFSGIITNGDKIPLDTVPQIGDHFVTSYKGTRIRLRTLDNSNRNAIRAVVICADLVSEELPHDLTQGAYVDVDISSIYWIHFKVK